MAAPNLFNVAVDYWVNNALTRAPNTGVNYHSRITDLCYADDVVVFAEITDTIADALTALHEEATPLGFTINWAKTKMQSLTSFLPILHPPRITPNDPLAVSYISVPKSPPTAPLIQRLSGAYSSAVALSDVSIPYGVTTKFG